MDADNEGSASRKTKVMMEKNMLEGVFSYCKEHLCIIYVFKNISHIDNHFPSLKYLIYILMYFMLEGSLTFRLDYLCS